MAAVFELEAHIILQMGVIVRLAEEDVGVHRLLFCVLFLGSYEENMFSMLENLWRHHRAAEWLPMKSCSLMITMGGMRHTYLSVGFVLGCLEGASTLSCGRCCSPGI